MNTEQLDQFVDGYIEIVLEVVDRIEQELPVQATGTHARLQRSLNDGKKLLDDATWQSASYALTAWTDELLVELPWAGRTWWNDHVLETSLFGTRECSERFYQLANEASANPENGLLRVYHDCVLLGFRGVYGLEDYGMQLVRQLNLPDSLSQWLSQMRSRISVRKTDVPASLHRNISGAPPHNEQRSVVWWAVAACTMVAVNVTVYSFMAS